MKNIKLKLGTKIFLGFFVLIFIFIINVVLSVYTLDNSKSIINESSEVKKPSLDALNQFHLMVVRSKMLATNWVFIQNSEDDKKALKQLHNVEYPALQNHIQTLMHNWEDSANVALMDTLFTKFEEILKVEENIMKELVSWEDYDDPMKKLFSEEMVETQILPATAMLIEDLNKLSEAKKVELAASEENLLSSENRLRIIIIGLGVITMLIGIASAYVTASSITKPLNYIKDVIQKLGLGELPEEGKRRFNKDEIGEMAEAVDKLVIGLKETSLFAENIGSGNLQASFTPLSENDVLGNSLLEMRSNLQKVADEDKKRNWTTEGLAKFGDILRSNNDNITKLADDIIINIVKYLNANQGGLYIVQDEETQDPYLSLIGCYAWDKKKYIDQKIYYGEGLTGQAWQEQDTLYITDVPTNYITITSGLGEANPRSILIVPLKINDKVYGVVELASFNEYESHEVEFVQKIGESIASTISTARINEKTSKLLEESQIMTEQMRAQEEEMRQNMEELQATQEEMQRSQRETYEKEVIFNKSSLIIETDGNFNITNSNNMISELLGLSAGEVIGAPISKLVESLDSLSTAKRTLSGGDSWKGILKLKGKSGATTTVKAAAGMAGSDDGVSQKYFFILTDVSELILA
jgi:PAS domain S-box-containing protein